VRHLFLAPLASAYGELLQGIRLAEGLHRAGHEVVVLAPARLHALVESAPVTFGRIDLALPHLDEQMAGLIARLRCDTLVLVDAAAVGKVVGALHLDALAFTQPSVPVLALDCWNLPATPLPWDYGPRSETLRPEFHQLRRRLVPVPVGPPDAAGAYNALPAVVATDRQRVRGELGLSADDRLILWPSAGWQHVENQTDPRLGRLAAGLPALILPHLAALGGRVKVLHVGPLPYAPDGTPGHRFQPQVAPRRFEELVAAADLLLGFNAVATSLATAVAAGVPILLGMTELQASILEEAKGFSPSVRAWIAAHLPLPRLRAWPLSLDGFLSPALAGNPLYRALRVADPLDEDGFIAACRELLFDEAAAAALRHREEQYRQQVASLPSATERFLSLL